MRHALSWAVFAIASISAGVAVADDKLKGTYAFVGTQMCLNAPSGFANDSKGNPTIPNGNNSYETVSNAQGLLIYNGDGTGKGTGTFVSFTPPPPDSPASPKAAMLAGTLSFSFTYTPILNNSFSITYVPGTYQGTFNYGPLTGQQFTIDTANRALLISEDQKYIATATATPYVENITYSAFPQSPLARSCIWSGNQFRAAEEQDADRPLLADLMALTQLRQFKLWYAQRVDNWTLANYELDQFVKTIDRMVKLYPAASSIAQANFIHEKADPALAALRKAIQDRNSSRFEAAFLQITDACNQCHQAADVGFIVVQTPTKSPYANQDFKPFEPR